MLKLSVASRCSQKPNNSGPKNSETPTGSGNVSTPTFLGAPVNFHKNKFLDPSTSSMRKVDDVATVGIASQPTEMPTACTLANW